METNPIERIKELKSALTAYLKTYRSQYLFAVKEYLEEIYMADGLKEIGCNEKCKECFLSYGEDIQAINPCKMWALYTALKDIEIKETKNPHIVSLSKELLSALKKR